MVGVEVEVSVELDVGGCGRGTVRVVGHGTVRGGWHKRSKDEWWR